MSRDVVLRPLPAAAAGVGAAAAVWLLHDDARTVLLAVLAGVLVVGLVLARQRRRASAAQADLLHRLERQSDMLAEAALLARLGSFTCDPATMTFAFTDELFALWGVPEGSPLRDDPQVFADHVLHPLDQPRVVAAFDAGLADGGRHDVEFRVRRVDTGEERHLRSTVEVVLGDDGRPARITGAQLDVTDLVRARHEAHDASALHRAVLAATPDVVFVTDLASRAPVYVSPSMQQVLGYTAAEVVELRDEGRRAHIHPDDLAVLRDADARTLALADGEVVQCRYRCLHADGGWVWVQRRATPFQRDDDGRVSQVLGVLRDVSDVVAAEQRLAHAALHDPLTGLPNRDLLTARLRAALQAGACGAPPAVVYLDLDGFKRVNDTAGHAAGDDVLREVARRLGRAAGPGATVARLGGDEFVVLLEDVDGARVQEEAARLLEVLDEPVQAGGQAHLVRASCGLVVAGPDADVEQLLQDADTAMYRAKALGRDRVQVFEEGLRDELAERLRVERVLRDALTEPGPLPLPRAWPRLELVYQPVVDGGGVVVGVEALSRLTDERGRPVRPDVFVSVAEESDLVRRLGIRVLDRALAQLARWREQAPGREALTMAVNVSAREAQDDAFVPHVLDALARHDLQPRDLVLELTETVLLEAGEQTLVELGRLHDLGVRIAIDDFGTGYASLRYLTELPVDLVKVDRGFTAGLPHDPKSATVVRAVIGLAEDLGLGCVVEGVETEEQRRCLPGSVHVQGYLLGRPLPACDVDLADRLALR
ncbi:MAG: cph2 3 [Frankiales bacterium]|nr:cph2 3 [Frankiales bacterium]